MSDRKRISYTFMDPDTFTKVNEQVIEIVKADTGEENWVCNKAMPPTCYPPALTTEAINELSKLDGVRIRELQE